jgi:hypothetical protein
MGYLPAFMCETIQQEERNCQYTIIQDRRRYYHDMCPNDFPDHFTPLDSPLSAFANFGFFPFILMIVRCDLAHDGGVHIKPAS